MKKILKKWQLIFLSCVLAFAPAYALANSALNGWTITDRIMDGATRVYNGAKNTVINGANVAKSSVARIKPTTDFVRTAITRTGAVLAVDLAIQSLIGGVDYVMDPANNRVIYYQPTDNDPNQSQSGYAEYSDNQLLTFATSKEQACRNILSVRGETSDYSFSHVENMQCFNIRLRDGSTRPGMYLRLVANPNYDPNAEPQQRYLPYSAVADELIGQAEGGDTRAGGYVGEAIDAEVAKGGATAQDVANQFDANAQTQTAEGANDATGTAEPNTANPEATDITLEFPAFCGWAPQVCEAANVVINFPTRLQNWWDTATNAITSAWTTFTEYMDWTKEQDLPTRDTSDITLPDTPITPQTVNVNFGKSCPAPTTVNISFGGQSKEITIMNYQFVCEWSWVVEYSVIALASISSVFIVAGRKS